MSTVEQATAAPVAVVSTTVKPVRQAAAEPVRRVTDPIRQRAAEVAAPVTTQVRETVVDPAREAVAETTTPAVTAQPATPPSPAIVGGPARGHKKPAGRAAVKVGTATSRRVERSESSAHLASDRRAARAAETSGAATRLLLPHDDKPSPAPTSRSDKPVADQIPPAAVSAAAPALLVDAAAGSNAAASASGGVPAMSLLTAIVLTLGGAGLVLTLFSPSASYGSAFLLAPIERPG